MSELQIERLSVIDRPFAQTGVDYFVPLLAKLSKKTWTNQAVAKLYGAIFTCLSLRALHTKLAGDLSTVKFHSSNLQIYIKKRLPKSVTSDNDTIFVGAQ